MFLYKTATQLEKSTEPILLAKHGSHNQASHGRKGGGGGGSGGGGGQSRRNPKSPKDKTPNNPKVLSAIDFAGKVGAESTEVASLAQAYNSKDVKSLGKMETAYLEAHASSIGLVDLEIQNKAMHTASVMALRDLTGEGSDKWPTIDEMDALADGADLENFQMRKHGSHNQASHGRKGGGGGGSGGGGDSSSRQSPQSNEDKLVQAAEELNNLMAGAKRVRDKATDKNAYDLANGTVKGYKAVFDALGDKKKMKMVRLNRNSKANMVMSGNLAPLQAGYRENVGFVNGATMALAQYGDL